MVSNNPTSGDDQQETVRTALDPYWVVGFVDGEGCFCVSFHRNPLVRQTPWQIITAFQVYQHERYRETLEAIGDFFGCGRIRPKGPHSSVLTYTVQSRRDLLRSVLPFFEQHPPRIKGCDFNVFATIVRRMERGEHLKLEGFEEIARLAYSMNEHGKQRARTIDEILRGSSETVRQASLFSWRALKRQSDPHGDMGSQAEMT